MFSACGLGVPYIRVMRGAVPVGGARYTIPCRSKHLIWLSKSTIVRCWWRALARGRYKIY